MSAATTPAHHPPIELSENMFELLKSNFQPPLLSRRRLASASDVYDLIEQLHKQHDLNVERLNAIKIYLNSHEHRLAVEEFSSQLRQPPADNTTNLYADERRNSNAEFLRSISAPAEQVPTTVAPNSFDHHKHCVYKIVAEEIGKKWRELGRELCVSEGDMDRIQEQHRDNIHSKVFAIFELFESLTDCRDRSGLLCNALLEVRRRDLSKRVGNILMS